MNTTEEVNSGLVDKMKGMDYCEKHVRDRGLDLRTIMWIREDEKGHQIFEVGYTTVLKSESRKSPRLSK